MEIEQHKQHAQQVAYIIERVKGFYKQKKKVRIYHGSTNSTRTQQFQKGALVDTSALSNVISIHKAEQYAIVEPNVPMDQLVKATLRYGLIPPVVMEFPGITVGGGIQGGAGESSSFKYGGFHHTCLEYEIVLGDGTLVTASPKKNADLYWGTACSYGSLGIITQAKIKLIPAKPYVQLTYHRVHSFEEAIEQLEKGVKKKIDFIDAVLFSKESGTIMTGILRDKKPLPVVRFGRATDDWFYTHAEKVTKQHEVWEELIPLEEYLFRYDRGAFWMGRYAFRKMRLPFNRFTRFVMNPLMHTRTLYRFLHAINISQRQIIQDLFLPKETVLEFMEFIDTKTGIYPLWLLPGTFHEIQDKLSPGFIKTVLGIDVGVWGKVSGDHAAMVSLNRSIEKTLTGLGGRKWLYAHQYYTKNEFWEVYDKKWYDKLREKYHANSTFPDVYEKTYVKERYTYSLVKGLLDVLKSPFRLPIKET